MNYVAIFHANLNYAFLEPHKYEQVIRASYEVILDTFAKHFPADVKYVFEASGFTIDEMARRTPDVLKKLRAAIDSGQCEFMGAPYSHPIMANVPEEDGRWACHFAMQAYERHLGFRPASAWNPECTWMQYVPRAFRDAGFRYLTLDFESYMTCNDKEYGWVERNRAHEMNWGGHLPWYDLDPDCPHLHQPFRDVVPGLHGLCRSDRLVGKYVGYFLGRLPLSEFIDNVKRWSGRRAKGATVIVADDAEYTGTTGYFFIKHFRDYSRSFEVDPGASDKLRKMVSAVLELGPMIGFQEACELEPVPDPFYVEDRFAWHRTYADAWANTPEARAWEPVLQELRRSYKETVQPVAESPEHAGRFRPMVEKFWFHMTNSANSDGRWPPPPAVTCPFNRQWVLGELAATRAALANLQRAVTGIPMPPPAGTTTGDTRFGYDLHFTDKDVRDVRRLNLYELDHALYVGFGLYDRAETRAEGRELLVRIFGEFKRRGVERFTPPALS